MFTGYQALSEKEKQTLRLIVRGHNAKSVAQHLGLSVHTINERLRDARRKLHVSSSLEAARMVLDTEGDLPEIDADKEIGEASSAASVAPDDQPRRRRDRRTAWITGGALIMSIVLGLLALAIASGDTGQADRTTAPSAQSNAAQSAQESDAIRAARTWLTLHDDGRWEDGYKATGSSFRQSNTLEAWTAAARKVRPPLGAFLSRTTISQESVPAGPAGVEVVKFRTSFANKANATETVSLAREGGQWKVVGIYLE